MDKKPPSICKLISDYLWHNHNVPTDIIDSPAISSMRIKYVEYSETGICYSHWVQTSESNDITAGYCYMSSGDDASAQFTISLAHPQALERLAQWILNNPNPSITSRSTCKV